MRNNFVYQWLLPISLFALFFMWNTGDALALTPLPQAIRSNTDAKELWQFFLSAVNYVFVAGLLVAIFANVLRFNIDTYGVKKILPSLLTGFLLANFSYFISTTLIDFSAVLSNTADGLVCNAMGKSFDAGAANAKCIWDAYKTNMWSHFTNPTTILAALATLATLIGGNLLVGIILGALGILVALFPNMVLGILWMIFYVRHYIVIYMVALSPVAFMAMGTPFTQGIFNRWWKIFSTWLFMKPIAYFVLAAGALVLVANLQIGDLLTDSAWAQGAGGGGRPFSWLNYFIALFIMGSSIMLAFSAGGAIMSKLYGAAKMLGSSARFGLGNLGHNLAEGKLLPTKSPLIGGKLGGAFGRNLSEKFKNINERVKGGKLGGLGRFMAGVAFYPEQLKEARAKRIAEITTFGQAEAASLAGDTTKATALKEKKIRDLGEKLPFQNINDLQNVINMQNPEAMVAFLDKMKMNGLLPIVIDQLKKIAQNDERIRKMMGLQNIDAVNDPVQFQMGLAKLLGSKVNTGQVKEIKDAFGNIIGQSQTAAIEDRFVADRLSGYEFDAFSKGKLHQFGHQNYDSDNQRYEIVLDANIHQAAQQAQITAFTSGKPQNIEKLFNFKNITQTTRDAAGNQILQLQDWIKNLARGGDINQSLLRGLTQFEGEADMKANWNSIRTQLETVSQEANSQLTPEVIEALDIRVNKGYEAMRKYLENPGGGPGGGAAPGAPGGPPPIIIAGH